jgi:hypothetical protein
MNYLPQHWRSYWDFGTKDWAFETYNQYAKQHVSELLEWMNSHFVFLAIHYLIQLDIILLVDGGFISCTQCMKWSFPIVIFVQKYKVPLSLNVMCIWPKFTNPLNVNVHKPSPILILPSTSCNPVLILHLCGILMDSANILWETHTVWSVHSP